MTQRRKYVQQLPGIIQTQYREKQFAATVDQVFQPGNIDSITGYVGLRPSYYDSGSDLYLSEPTPERQQHQLEPTMVSRSSTGVVTDILSYDDLINYLDQNNGVTSNQDRLFSNPFYTWAPPVDLDKLNNHTSYYWFGDQPDLLPELVLTCPCATYISDGSTATFAIPPRLSGANVSRDSVTLLVAGESSHRWSQSSPDQIEFSLVPPQGSRIDVYRYGDFSTLMSGQTAFDASQFNDQGVSFLTSNMRVRLVDALGSRSFWIEGVGESIALVSFNATPTALTTTPNYTTIDRRSSDQNAWSLSNYWVHKNAFSWSGLIADGRIAARPIVEFIADLELYNYGSRRIETTITCKVSGNPLFGPGIFARNLNQLITDYDYVGWDSEPYQSSAIVEIPVADINSALNGSIYVDTQHALTYGDSLLVVNNVSSPYNNCILQIDQVADPTTGSTILAAVVSHVPLEGDLVQMPVQGLIAWDEPSEGFDTNLLDYNSGTIELYFNGIDWVPAQPISKSVDPVFTLYDADGISQASLTGSTFTGSRVFGYADGAGANDPVLGRPLAYDGSGNVLFENYLSTTRAASSAGLPIGFQWFKINAPSGSYLGNGWLRSTTRTSQSILDDQVWSIPRNLSANPLGEEVSTISKPDWFDQFSGIVSGQTGLQGAPYSLNNYRDTLKDRSIGSRIIQNESPLLRSMLLASDPQFDVFTANNYVEREYARFRRKFFQQITVCYESGTCTLDQAASTWVSTILSLMRVTKVADGPFNGSTMAGGNYFVPPTASFLGLMPPVEPEIIIDNTYSTPVSVLVGHDGSRVPCVGDYRDTVMLALETAIYQSVPSRFKEQTAFDFTRLLSGCWRTSTACYGSAEIAQMLSPFLLRWAQINSLDFTTNNSYSVADPFTFNYRGTLDVFGNANTGNWRSIYRFLFDTDSPHARPWEMLGFASKPNWFDAEYGPSPYTSGNTFLWNDIRDGLIRQGSRAGIDAAYARPQLYQVLPVDEGGALLDPIAAKIVPRAPTAYAASANWRVGDHGPVENLWITSPSYGFAKAAVAFLMRPAEWVETGWDTQACTIKNGQKLFIDTLDRTASPQTVHGEVVGQSRVVRFGLQQWVSDMLRSKGASPALLGAAMRGVDVQLAHKMAGFTQKDNLRVRADTVGILPSENVEIVFYEPAPFRSSTYSNIIIEWVDTGWSVVGYDNLHNFFPTLVGDSAGPTTTISLGKNPIVYEWRTGVSYPVGRLVNYNGSYYACAVAHIAGPSFVLSNWTLRSDLIFYPQVDVYNRSSGMVKNVPYGTVFTTILDVARFIRDYMRWLEAEGWSFPGVDPTTGTVTDYAMMIRQFLEWTQIKYVAGNFIALAPGAIDLIFESDHGQSYSLMTSNGAPGILDRQGKPIPARNLSITRDGGSTQIQSERNDLAMARVSLGEIEHIMLVSNTTVFNDQIYRPLYDIRVDRLYLIGNRVSGWTGRRDAPGYVIVDNDLLPSFAKAEDNVRHAFDIETSEDPLLREYARHTIGYQSRSYLDNLLVDETEQFEFYQGMIKEKGTQAAFSRLARSKLIEQNTDIAFLEEWALLLSRYGAIARDETFSFTLRRQDIRDPVQRVDLGVTSTSTAIGLSATDARWIEQPSTANIFPTVNPIPAQQAGFGVPRFAFNPFDNPLLLSVRNFVAYTNAGYVRLGETDMEAFSTAKLETLYDTAKSASTYIRHGTRIWVYDRGDGNFDVLKAFYAGDPANVLTSIETIAEDISLGAGLARLTFNLPHYLGTSDIGLNVLLAGQTGTTTDMEGFTQIVSVDSATSIIVNTSAMSGYNYTTAGLLGYNPPPFYIMRSMHFADLPSAKQFWSRFTPDQNDLIYVDNAGAGSWVVYRWIANNRAWSVYREQPQKIDSTRMVRPVIYSKNTDCNDGTMTSKPVLLDAITILDPIAGLLPGEAMREISYALDYDPAVYNNATANSWGKSQVGQLWWDLSTVRYLVPETDVLYLHDDQTRTSNEIAYRQAVWAAAAPGSSFDVYEWTRSSEYPSSYDGDGVVLDTDNPSYVVVEEYDPDQRQTVIVYYYWVLGRTVVPDLTGRNVSALSAATTLANPRTNDLPWMAPISSNSFILCNIEQYVSDNDTALEVSVRDTSISGIPHAEWQIVGKNDGNSVPPEAHWKALRSSLTGFTDQGAALPSSLLQAVQQVGYGPGKTLFSNGRTGVLAARKTFVQTVNSIFARSPVAVNSPNTLTALTLASGNFPYLVWRSTDTRTSYVVPPTGSFDYAAVGREQRDGLLRQAVFEEVRGNNLWESSGWETEGWEAQTASATASKVRILVVNPDGDTPGWSVYQIDPTKAQSSDNPDDWLIPAKQYDVIAASYADMLLDIFAEGDRVLVQQDEYASDFSTTWLYSPSNRYANSDGFVELGIQTYRTSDFVSLVDWYADGYTIDKQPSVHYADIIARNIGEGQVPQNSIVQVDDCGDGSWAWTYWDGTSWTLVARQNGTIALSDAFFDPTLSVFGLGDYRRLSVAGRDGTLELQAIIDALRTTVFDNGQLNEVYFSMLHFIYSQQDEIDWSFKTSFLSIEGFNDTLKQSPIADLDNTENLLDYIEEIKPYRVKTRQYVRTVGPAIDDVPLHVTDFDLPVYYDETSGKWRRLSTVSDSGLLSTLPYSDWFSNYQRTSFDPGSPDFNPVRRLEITMNFDRVDPGTSPLDQNGSALLRLQSLYRGRDGLENEASLVADNAMTHEVTVTGSGTPDESIDGNQPDLVLRGDFGRLRSAEELASTALDDALSITIEQTATVGAPYQVERFSQRKTAKLKIDCVLVPADTVSVFVFMDGLRAPASSYSVDLAAHMVTITMPTPRPSVVLVHAIGIGGVTLISERRDFQGDGVRTTFDLHRTPHGYLDVYLNNSLVPSSSYTLTGSLLTFASAPANGTGIVVIARDYGASNSTDTETRAVRQTIVVADYATGSIARPTYTIADPTAVSPGPQHVGSIVELNGARLRHPFTRYVDFNKQNRSTNFTTVTALSDLSVWVGGIIYTGVIEQLPVNIPVGIPADYVGKYDYAPWDDEMLYDVEGDITLIYDDLVANNPSLNGSIIACLYESHDFDVVGNQLTVLRPIEPTDLLEITTFHNGDLLNMQVNSFNGSADGLYRVGRTPGDAYLVAMDGLTQARGLDYEIKTLVEGFDSSASDESGFDVSSPNRFMVMNRGGSTERFDVTCFAGRFASDDFIWHSASNRPSPQMMGLPLQQYVPPQPPGGQWDVLPWESGIEPWDHPTVPTEGSQVPLTALSSQGLRDLFAMKGTYDMTTWRPADLSILSEALMIDATEINLTLNPLDIDPDEMSQYAYMLPAPGAVGVVWIGSERIEYTECTSSNGTATLSGLRRATHGTSTGGEQRQTITYPASTGQRSFTLADSTLVEENLTSQIEVSVVNNGQKTPMRANVHYLLSLSSGVVTADFAVAPNATVVISHTSGFYHPAGSECRSDNVGILVPAEE